MIVELGHFAAVLALAVALVQAVVPWWGAYRGDVRAIRTAEPAAFVQLGLLVVAFLAAYAVPSGKTAFLDVAIAYALIAFLGTVALSRFLIRSRLNGGGHGTMGGKDG